MEFAEKVYADIEEILNGSRNGNKYVLPIDELDGIRVAVEIQKIICYDKTERYYLNVRLADVFNIDDNHLNVEYLLFHSDDLKTLDKTLIFTKIFCENFVVDLIKGKFITKSLNESESRVKLALFFSKNPRVKVCMDECCVCKDTMTETKTSCGHPVCIRCISKLPKNEDADDYDMNDEELGIERKCPMCRTEFCRIE